jgi:hypothetical protein
MRRLLILTAAILAAVVVFVLVTLPPAPAVSRGTIDPALAHRTWPGAFHVHSSRSDGADSKGSIAAAAARAGLRFVVFTEHGDGTRAPDLPTYIDGVLCLDGVEISTNGGHYVAVDLPATPYRLGGEAAAVAEDVRRFGGFGIAAHPDSLKAALAWSDWSIPVDGLEWLNVDSEWRDESRFRLARTFLAYFVRPGPALASLFDRPSTTIGRWDALTAHRRVVGLAGHDAHGWIAGRQEGSTPSVKGVPSYEAAFRSLALRAILPSAATGEAVTDARRLIDAIRGGSLFTAIDAVAFPALLDFHAQRGPATVVMGQSIPAGEGAVTFSAQPSLPEGAEILLFRNGIEVARAANRALAATAAENGAYRIEVHVPGAPGSPPVPWIVSNPIYLSAAEPLEQPAPEPVRLVTLDTLDWRIEKDPASSGAVTKRTAEATLEYRLKAGEETSQYVAMAADLTGVPPDANAVLLRLRSSNPDRVMVQLRSAARGGARLIASAFVSPDVREITIGLPMFRSAERDRARFDLREASSLLIVADLTNHLPGAAGDIEVSGVSFARVRPAGPAGH